MSDRNKLTDIEQKKLQLVQVNEDFAYPSHFAELSDGRMHYIEAGEGQTILFIHGMPTYSYLWRNIIPCLSDVSRCVALDLMGMGLSAKPDIEYSVFDHIRYVTEFIEKLKLKNIILVLHGWGSVIGFTYATQHPENVKGLIFYESHVRAATHWDMLSLPVQQLAIMLKRQSTSYRAIIKQNYMIEKLLPSGVLRNLTDKEKAYYAKPFPTPESRKPLWQYILELPLGHDKGEVVDLIERYSAWLQGTDIPKLMLYAIPGFITTISTVQWSYENLKNLAVVELQDALHFAQESIPERFAQELRQWYLKYFSS